MPKTVSPIEEEIIELVNKALLLLGQKEGWEFRNTPPVVLTRPKNTQHGDYSCNIAFPLASQLRLSPLDIADKIVEALQLVKAEASKNALAISEIRSIAGYVNFHLDTHYFFSHVLRTIFSEKERYGFSAIGKKQRVMVEFSSPNVAKKLTLGHFRTTNIGEALARAQESQGYTVVRWNYLGDWGTQLGMILYGLQFEKKDAALRKLEKESPIDFLREVYVRVNTKAEKNEAIQALARHEFGKLVKGDKTQVQLLAKLKKLSLKEYAKTYKLMGITFDTYDGEAAVEKSPRGVKRVLQELEEKKLLKESQGARIVDLTDFSLPPALIQKNDGTTLYLTRDIAGALVRFERYKFTRMVYQVDSRQALNFHQLKAVLILMGYKDLAERIVHSAHGLFRLGNMAMSTRKGKFIELGEAFDQAIQKTLAIIEAKNPQLRNKKKVAEQVGIGALRFFDLLSNKETDINFDWNRILDWNGKSGPYVQYTHARLQSILRKAKARPAHLRNAVHFDVQEPEQAILDLLLIYPEILREAADALLPHLLAEYLYKLAQAANRFYNALPVVAEKNPTLRMGRLAIVAASAQVLANGLDRLGIAAPEAM